MASRLLFTVLGISFLFPMLSWTQVNLDNNEIPPDSLTVDSNKIEIIFIKKLRNKEKKEEAFKELIGDVHLRQMDMHLWCDSGLVKPRKEVEAFGNVQMLHTDSTRLFSDSLFYDGLIRQARLREQVVLKDSSMTLFTDKLDYDFNTKIATFPEGSLIDSDTVTLVSKRGTYNARTKLAHFQNSVRLTSSNYQLTADSLDFNTESEVAYFISPTTVFHEEKTIYCEDGFYDSKKEYAELKQNAWFENREEGKEEYAKGDKIIFDGQAEKYYLIGNAFYQNVDQEVEADTIIIDGKNDKYSFKGNPKLKNRDTSQHQTIDAEFTDYDANTGAMIFRREVRVEKDNNILTTDSLDYNSKTKEGLAVGNVVWIDTVADTKITCTVAYYNDSIKFIKASGNPVLRTLVDGDTMWIRADTLISSPPNPANTVEYTVLFSMDSTGGGIQDTSGLSIEPNKQDTTLQEQAVGIDSSRILSVSDTFNVVTDSSSGYAAASSTNPPRNLKAYHNVVIYKADMQVLCDSLFYDDVDSIFNFYDNPILWVDETQFSADTIQVLMKQQKVHRVYLHQNAFITNTKDTVYFNQIKGDEVITRFAADSISDIKIEGSGEIVYYAKDDEGAFIGVNDVDCQDMFLFFSANELRRIRFEVNPTAVLYPMGQVLHKSLELVGFRWLDAIRPRSKWELIDYNPDKYLLFYNPHDSLMEDTLMQDSLGLDTLIQDKGAVSSTTILKQEQGGPKSRKTKAAAVEAGLKKEEE